jgi:CDP-glycerol glycerophosphotransferase
VVLYAPTWRDGEVDPGIPSAAEWRAIAAQLEASDSTLVLRPHPHGVGDYAAGLAMSEHIVLLDSARCTDVTPVLPAVDALVTDYSSIAYDFALLGRPIVFLAPDVDAYSASRGLYAPYDSFSGGSQKSTWTELLAVLAAAGTDDSVRGALVDHAEALATTHHAFRDGDNTARVYRQITTRLKEHE